MRKRVVELQTSLNRFFPFFFYQERICVMVERRGGNWKQLCKLRKSWRKSKILGEYMNRKKQISIRYTQRCQVSLNYIGLPEYAWILSLPEQRSSPLLKQGVAISNTHTFPITLKICLISEISFPDFRISMLASLHMQGFIGGNGACGVGLGRKSVKY